MCLDFSDIKSKMNDVVVELKRFSSSKYADDSELKQKPPCSICSTNGAGKYKCPRCSMLTCSVQCSKQHKEQMGCDGQRPPWQPILKHSQFDDEKSVEDQHFLSEIGGHLGGLKRGMANEESKNVAKKPVPEIKPNNLTVDERFLLQNAKLRRIWLQLNEKYSADGSRHERFSDTIFWACGVKFVRYRTKTGEENAENVTKEESTKDEEEHSAVLLANGPIVDGYGTDEEAEEDEAEMKEVEEEKEGEISIDDIEMDEDEEEPPEIEAVDYTVHNIPESIRVCTLLRQFLRPKPHGPIISRAQLDLQHMEPFIRACDSLLPAASSSAISQSSLSGVSSSSDNESADKLTVYLEVDMCSSKKQGEGDDEEEETRYYIVDPSQTILDNLRNRHVNGYPRFVVVLRRGSEFGELELPLIGEEEQRQMKQTNPNWAETEDRPRWQQPQRGGGGGRNNNWQNNNNRRGRRPQPHRQQQQQGQGWRGSGGQHQPPPAHQRQFHPYNHYRHPYPPPYQQPQQLAAFNRPPPQMMPLAHGGGQWRPMRGGANWRGRGDRGGYQQQQQQQR